jgi:glycosyltransferase involved in cell wall biosynthesis
MKFSVIIPTFNRAKRLNILLWRLANGNYPKDKFEVIVVDGNSTDDTTNVVLSYRESLNIILINSGSGHWENPVRARNIAYYIAWGTYSVMLDADYVPSEDILSEFSWSLQSTDLVYGFAIDSSKGFLGSRADDEIFYNITPKENKPLFTLPIVEQFNLLRLPGPGPMPEWLFATKTSIIREIGGYDLDYLNDYGREDSDIFQRLIRRVPNYHYNPRACCIHIYHSTAGPKHCRDVTVNHGIFERRMRQFPFEIKRNVGVNWGCVGSYKTLFSYRDLLANKA